MCGFLNMRRGHPSESEYLARVAALHGILGRVPPMRPIPLVTGPESCIVARWGWPSPRGGILTHARSETAATLTTWARAWRNGRGIIPVDGWEEGSWAISAQGAHLAVLWTLHGDDARLAVLTQPPPAEHGHIERFPIPLTQAGALAWLDGGTLDGQIEDLAVTGTHGQATLFDR